MYIHPRIKVAAFLLLASGVGGFLLATKLTQYFFEKHHARAGGGDREQDGDEKDGNGKKKGSGDGDGEAEQAADGQEDDAEEGQFKAGDEVKGAEAIKYLVGKTIRINPGQRPLRYSYHARRGLFGEGDPARFSLRTWSTRGMNMCETQPRGMLQCHEVTVIIGPLAQPKGKGKNQDIALTPEEVRELVQEAKKSATWTQKKAADKAAVKRDETLRGGAVLQTGDADAPPHEYADGEQMATLVIGERAFPILKGNLIGFPKFIPTIDKPKAGEAPKPPADTPTASVVVAPPPAAKAPSLIGTAQADATPPKPAGFAPPKPAKGFGDPKSLGQSFGAPRQRQVARSFQAVNAGGDPPITGKEAWDRIVGQPLAPVGAKPVKPLPYLGFFLPDGLFLQLTRDKDLPLEVMVSPSRWTFNEGRLCYAAPAQAARPARKPAAKGLPAGCVSPSLSADESNLLNFRGERLAISTRLELPTRDALKALSYGPPKPANFRPVGATAEALRNSAPADEERAGGASHI